MSDLAGYYPTCHLRVAAGLDVVQQLWVSVCEDDAPKWVDLPRVWPNAAPQEPGTVRPGADGEGAASTASTCEPLSPLSPIADPAVAATDWHKKPPKEVRDLRDALLDAGRLRRELPQIVQVRASDWDKVILADEVLRLMNRLALLKASYESVKNPW